ncbi:MAG: hypothetical protein R3F59_13805 [Myxococcota bacterium]
MASPEPSDPRLRQRPLLGLLILAVPVVAVVLTLVAYAGMVGLGLRGRQATGPPVPLRFDGCAEAGPVLAARLRDMGVEAEPGDGPLSFVASLPTDPAVAASIPATLAMPGRLEVRGGDQVLAGPSDVVDASVRADVMMVPTTLVHLSQAAAARVRDYVRANPTGRMHFAVDGQVVGSQSNEASEEIGEVEITPEDAHGRPMDDGRARWDLVAAWSVTVDHPLPCAVTVRGASGAAPP